MDAIKKAFSDERPEAKAYVISDPRGSNKTVLLTSLAKSFKDEVT